MKVFLIELQPFLLLIKTQVRKLAEQDLKAKNKKKKYKKMMKPTRMLVSSAHTQRLQ